jgi:hypothetical protein
MLKVVKILFGTDDIVKICEEISITSNKTIECDLSQFSSDNDNIPDYENFIKITIESLAKLKTFCSDNDGIVLKKLSFLSQCSIK